MENSKYSLNTILPRPRNPLTHRRYFDRHLTESEAERECLYQITTYRTVARLHVPPTVIEARFGAGVRYKRPFVPLIYFAWTDEDASGMTDACSIWLHAQRNPECVPAFDESEQDERERSRLAWASVNPLPEDAHDTGVTDFPFTVDDDRTSGEIRSIAVWTPLHVRRDHSRVLWNTLHRCGWELLDRDMETTVPLATAYKNRDIGNHTALRYHERAVLQNTLSAKNASPVSTV